MVLLLICQPIPEFPQRAGTASNLPDEQYYLTDRDLPEDDKRARELTLSRSQYAIVDQIPYHVEKDGNLQIIPPSTSREKLFHEAHSGTCMV